MDFVDTSGTRYQLSEAAEAPTPIKKAPLWPWVVGGIAVAGGLVWMASQTSRKANPVDLQVEALILEARDPNTEWDRLVALSWRYENDEVRRALLDNPNLCHTNEHGKLKLYLLENLARQFPEEVAAHPTFVLHALIEPTNEMNQVVTIVARATTDVSLIESLLRVWGPSSWTVRQAVAMNKTSSHKILRSLGNPKNESDRRVRTAVVVNKNTPEDLLRLMGNEATEPDWRVREIVAQDPSTPRDILRILGNQLTESEWRVREWVVMNKNTPVDLLRILGNEATESEGKVRQAVAQDPMTPVDVLRLLGNEATESEWYVRKAVAENPNTPRDVLRLLGKPTTESNKDVRKAAKKALAKQGVA